MFGFLMGLMTMLQAGKKKITKQTEKYKDKREEYRRRMNKTLESDEDSGHIETSEEGIKDKSKKSKKNEEESLKTRALAFLSAVVLFFEMLPTFFTVIVWVFLIVILTILVVIIFAFLATLQAAIAQEDADRLMFNQDDTTGMNSCSQVGITGGKVPWTEADLASRGAKLTDREKNMYRMGILARDATEGYGGEKYLGTGDDSLDMMMLLGIASMETSMRFYADNSQHDITKKPSTIGINSKGYGFMGLHHSVKLSSKIPQSVRDNMAQKYKPQGSMSYDAQYAPWALLLSAEHLSTKKSVVDDGTQKGAKIDNILSSWGIQANKEEAKSLIYHMLLQAQYHGAYKADYDGYINYWAAIFYVTSNNDAERSWSKWGYSSGAGYDESSVRYSFMGGTGFSRIANKSNFLTLNGVEIGMPLPQYLDNQLGSNANYQKGRSTYFSMAGAQRDQAMNFHYGFNSFLQGKRIEEMLAEKMGVVGQSQPTVDCGDGSVTPTPGNFTSTPGKGQATVNGKPVDQYMDEWLSKNSGSVANLVKSLRPTWGTSTYLDNPESRAARSGYKDKYFGVPFYGQGSSWGEKYGTVRWHPNSGGTPSRPHNFNRSGCMVYSHAYVASALTGKLINAGEMGSIMLSQGTIVGAGVYGSKMPETYKSLGLDAQFISNGRGAWSEIKQTLQKGGLAVLRFTGRPFSSGSNHYIVLTGIETKDGKDYYSMYSSYSTDQSTQVYTQQYLLDNGHHKDVTLITKQGG